jgi:probable F420-dependent oxidoreductase
LRPRLVIGLPNYDAFLRNGEWRRLIEVAAAAERAGIDAVSVADHVVLGGDLDGYPYGSFPGGPEGHWLEPLTTLAAFAGATSTIRLMTGVLIAPLRPAALLAKTAATLDQISAGRLELGVGSGWLKDEYDAVGLSFAERGRLLDDTLAACEELWNPGPSQFQSAHISLSGVHCEPRPIQRDGIPLWTGGELHGRNIRRIVTKGLGWLPPPGSPLNEIVEGARRLRSALADNGCDPTSLRLRVLVGPKVGEVGASQVGSTFRNLPKILDTTGATDVLLFHGSFRPRFDGHEEALYEELVAAFETALEARDSGTDPIADSDPTPPE